LVGCFRWCRKSWCPWRARLNRLRKNVANRSRAATRAKALSSDTGAFSAVIKTRFPGLKVQGSYATHSATVTKSVFCRKLLSPCDACPIPTSPAGCESCAFLRYAGIGKARSRLVLPGWVMDAFESPLFPDFGSLDKRSAFPARLSSVHRIKSVLPADSIKTEHKNDHFDHFYGESLHFALFFINATCRTRIVRSVLLHRAGPIKAAREQA
jgi:hypothetical protein